MDEKVSKFVAHTGFPHFEKGILWHERMFVLRPGSPAPLHSLSARSPPSPFLTATNFWERASSTRAFYDPSFDCLYAHRSPAKEIGGESCVHRFLPAIFPGSP